MYQTIKPEYTEKDAVELAESLYGLKEVTVTSLMGYDDRNFRIIADRQEFVLKVVNAHESKNHGKVFILASTGSGQFFFLWKSKLCFEKPYPFYHRIDLHVFHNSFVKYLLPLILVHL